MLIGYGNYSDGDAVFRLHSRVPMNHSMFMARLRELFPKPTSKVLVTGSLIRMYANSEEDNYTIVGVKKNISEVIKAVTSIFDGRFSIAESATGDLTFTGVTSGSMRVRIRLRTITPAGYKLYREAMASDVEGSVDKSSLIRRLTGKKNSAHLKITARHVGRYLAITENALHTFEDAGGALLNEPEFD